MINVFIIGSKGIPARYGGFETFVENLTKRKKDDGIHYFVSCMGKKRQFDYNGASCFSLSVPVKGPIGRIFNVSKALSFTEKKIKEMPSSDSNIVYILGCRIGLLLKHHQIRIHKLGGLVVCNPDGLEWKRGKWNRFEKRVLKYCEKRLVTLSDYVICDSVGIEDYIKKTYSSINNARITYLAYGCDSSPSKANPVEYREWIQSKGITTNGYFLVVGRFVPENNLELIIREFMASSTKRDLVIVTNISKNKFYRELRKNLQFEKDPRIKFVGTVYDEEKLKMIRQNAFGYIHGHSVGGTNPSLLEAMSQTKINILFDVPFNREVGQNQVLYFSSQSGSLRSLMDKLEINPPLLDPVSIVKKNYSWEGIVQGYETFFESVVNPS